MPLHVCDTARRHLRSANTPLIQPGLSTLRAFLLDSRRLPQQTRPRSQPLLLPRARNPSICPPEPSDVIGSGVTEAQTGNPHPATTESDADKVPSISPNTPPSKSMNGSAVRALTHDAMMRNKPASSMQKTYDECYLICSTAVYFEGQVRECYLPHLGYVANSIAHRIMKPRPYGHGGPPLIKYTTTTPTKCPPPTLPSLM